MEVVEVRTVPEREVKVVTGIICDSCGTKSAPYRSWAPGLYELLEIDIQKREGSSYPGSYTAVTETFHCCPECWEEKVKPLFKTGPTVIDTDN